MRKIFFFFLACVVIVVGLIVFYTYPRHISLTMKGVEYQVGNKKYPLKHVSLDVNGELSRSLFSNEKFQGIIQISGASVHNPDNDRQLTINFDKKGSGVMAYGFFTNGNPIVHKPYGDIFINNRFTQVTILELLPNGWSSSDGVTISAPARNRSQAVTISNQLMKKWLNGSTLN